MADFDEGQIGRYIDRWFAEDETKRRGCRRALLENRENVGLRELAQVLLLLSLLCLVYEERNEIPPERYEIYEEATRALLSKWDASRNISRDTVYEKLTLNRKQELLANLTERNFKQDVYFVRETDLTRQIVDYLAGVPGLEDPEGSLVLQSMEAQHGILVERARAIHSFSHLTMQEYYTARYIVANESRSALQALMTHVGDNRWREVFLLVVGMLSDVTIFCEAYLHAVGDLMAGDAELVNFLTWAEQKGAGLDVCYKEAAVRAFLLGHAFVRVSDLDPPFYRTDEFNLTNELIQVKAYTFAFLFARALALASDFDLGISNDLDLELALFHTPEFFQSFGHTQAFESGYEYGLELAEGWQANILLADLRELGVPPNLKNDKDFEPWTQRFFELLKPFRDRWDPYLQMPVGDEEAEQFLKLDRQQVEKMSTYLEANQLLQRCLQVAYVPDRAAIEDRMLLLPGR
ncbi:MAG: NACHT domain-containing protein [Candidatus Promineifilaceae bacterium]